jgi:hypothetical protein
MSNFVRQFPAGLRGLTLYCSRVITTWDWVRKLGYPVSQRVSDVKSLHIMIKRTLHIRAEHVQKVMV